MNDIERTRVAVNFRKAPKPEIIAKCSNCKHFVYDADDREGPRGIYFEKKNKRCRENGFSTSSGQVCDKHDFKWPDKRDV